MLSLVGRGETVDNFHRPPDYEDRVQELKKAQMVEMGKEERFKQEQLLKQEKEEGGEKAEEE